MSINHSCQIHFKPAQTIEEWEVKTCLPLQKSILLLHRPRTQINSTSHEAKVDIIKMVYRSTKCYTKPIHEDIKLWRCDKNSKQTKTNMWCHHFQYKRNESFGYISWWALWVPQGAEKLGWDSGRLCRQRG